MLSLWQAFEIDIVLSTSVLSGIVSSHLLESLEVAPDFWAPETRRATQALDRVRSLGFQSVSLLRPMERRRSPISMPLLISVDHL